MSSRVRYVLLTAVWLAVIVLSSSTPATAQETDFPTLFDWILHNGAHVLLYGVLGWLYLGVAQPRSRWSLGVALLAALAAALTGVADERYQSLAPGREASLLDVGLDTLGALLGVTVGRYLRQ